MQERLGEEAETNAHAYEPENDHDHDHDHDDEGIQAPAQQHDVEQYVEGIAEKQDVEEEVDLL